MRHLSYILLFVFSVLFLHANAQTPYDSFAPETSRPMLGIAGQELQTDSILCAVVADMQNQILLLVDVSNGEVIATAPLTDDVRKWLSVDPLADKYPNISPYAYCGWNPINAIDPDGREEWELDVNTGNFQNISNKGGSYTDYYKVGSYEGETFSSYTDYKIERGDGTINSFRIQETDNSTISAFHIPETNFEGFFLERPGPDTEKPGQALRIPAGQYGLYENPGSNYPGVPRLYSTFEGIGGAFEQRGILMHIGNKPDDTKGCLLPGSTMSTDFVGSSGNTLKIVMNYIVTTGWGCKLNIFNTSK